MIIQEIVDEVVETFQKTGMTPIQGQYFDFDRNCACGIGVLTVSSEFEHTHELEAHLTEQYGESFVGGFISGFDGKEIDFSDYNPDNHWEVSYRNGYETGLASWQAVTQKEDANENNQDNS